MVGFSDIAVFILATTRTNGRYKQDYMTYFESRIVPIRETWGQYFPSLYFVFGTNKFDHDFLSQQCRVSGDETRQLASRDKQVQPEHTLVHYKCPIYHIEARYKPPTTTNVAAAVSSQPMMFEFDALWAGNCTGEYFGIGPTCRCQEAMRFYETSPALSDTEWMIFMDDDIYYRPFALETVLSRLAQEKGKSSIAVVSANRYRSFQFSKNGPKNGTTTLPHRCKDSPAYEFAIAQPALLNR
jgi:hypothetical protein